MFFFDGAYTGVSPVEDGKFNVACLSSAAKYNEWKSAAEFMMHLRSENAPFNRLLERGKCLFSNWMTVSAPEFGMRKTPDWPHTYFIGDAADQYLLQRVMA